LNSKFYHKKTGTSKQSETDSKFDTDAQMEASPLSWARAEGKRETDAVSEMDAQLEPDAGNARIETELPLQHCYRRGVSLRCPPRYACLLFSLP
jgi:hypothetical protein